MWHLSFRNELICVELRCHGMRVIDESLDPRVGTLQRLMPLFSLRTMESFCVDSNFIMYMMRRLLCLLEQQEIWVLPYRYLGDGDPRVYYAHSSTYNSHRFAHKIGRHERFWSTSTLSLVVQTSHQNANFPSPMANSSIGAIKKQVYK